MRYAASRCQTLSNSFKARKAASIFLKPLCRSIRFRSAMAQGRTYDDAVDALNTLQTNFKVLEARRKAGIRVDGTAIEDMRGWLEKIGYSPSDLNALNVLHVAGTKGKGSTCAFISSILNTHRLTHSTPSKIGLFTSPHLMAVRERIRINGSPISESLFAKYFWEVWDRLESSVASSDSQNPESTSATASKKEIHSEKPAYFRYLTLMSWHVFLQEKVDTAIYEVGVGGQYDSTNLIPKPCATGVTTLDIDHVFVLGDTIESIAWHKAGIFKKGVPAFTVKQREGAMKVLEERASELEAEDGKVVLVGEDERLRRQGVQVKPDKGFQRGNVSLSIRMAETLLQKLQPGVEMSKDVLPETFVKGIEGVVWRGRCEILVKDGVRWYIDGAHTKGSLVVAAGWFDGEVRDRPGNRVLIFNQQGRSEAVDLLVGFYDALKAEGLVRFHHVVFCTNVTYAQKGYKKDFVNHTYDSDAIASLSVQKAFAAKWAELDPTATVKVVPSIEEATDYAKSLVEADREKEVQAFVTGSLHLVGGALGVLEGTKTL